MLRNNIKKVIREQLNNDIFSHKFIENSEANNDNQIILDIRNNFDELKNQISDVIYSFHRQITDIESDLNSNIDENNESTEEVYILVGEIHDLKDSLDSFYRDLY